MKKNIKTPLIIVGLIGLLILAFLAGAYFYRAGILTQIKSRLLPQPTPTAAEITPEIVPDFNFQFLEDPGLAAMNSTPLENNDEPIKFLVSGHIYGKPGEDDFHPSPTLLRNISLLRLENPDFVVFLGDTVWKPSNENFDLLDLLILDPFEVPVFNAVGNHDVTKRDLYQSRYGNTVYAFVYKHQLFFILDTTLKYYDLNADQLSFVENTIEDQIQISDITTVNIFMHHVLFLDEGEVSGKQLLKPNEGDGTSAAFHEFLQSTIYPISQSIPVYIYAGDVGAFSKGNLSPLYKKSPDYDVTFVATGIGNNKFDSILIVQEDPNGLLNISPFSLTGKSMNPIENYDFQYWLSK